MGLTKRLFPGKKGLQEALQRPSSWVLIAVNLGLVIGVIAWDWQVFDIVFLYWVENLVIGAINVLKMIAASPGGMMLAIGLLASSHLFSFFRNFLGGGEYKRTHAAALMMRPYGRIVALHITIIFGAFLTMAFGSPLGLLVILMVLKTLVDLAMHQSERAKFKGLY